MKYYTIPLAVVVAISPLLQAADFSDEIIVTASRMAETADEALASVTVIDRDEIEYRQLHTVPELLERAAGLSLSSNGGNGKATNVNLRGTESRHVLVFIDGVKIGSATMGTASFQHLPIDQVERVEVVRGPRSSLYGSEAVGGVIQIFTRKGADGFNPFASLTAGTDETYKITVGASGGNDKGWFNFSLSSESTQGYDICDGVTNAGCRVDESDKDGYDRLSGSLNGGIRFDRGELSLNWVRSEGTTEYDGNGAGFFPAPNESDYLVESIGATLSLSITENWRTKVTVGQSLDEQDNRNTDTNIFVSSINTRRETASWINDITLAEGHVLTLGIDYQNDNVNSTTAYTVTSRDNTGLFAQYKGRFGDHDVQLSLREDDNEQFGSHETGNIAWGYDINDQLRVMAAYGTAFVAPTFNQLYWPNTGFGGGNPNLVPEESESYELGLSGDHQWGQWSLNLFQTEIDNLISGWPPANVNKALIEGLEAALSTELLGWQVNAALTLQKPRDKSEGANHGNRLARRPDEKFSLDIGRDFGRYNLGATLVAEGDRYDEAANDDLLESYERVDIRAGFQINKDWGLQAKVENLFDREYETVDHYPQPGRGVFVTLRYQPEK